MSQKAITKTLFWIGITGFVADAFTIVAVSFANLFDAFDELWIVLLAFTGIFAVSLVNWAIVFLRNPIFPPEAQKVPRKYYGIVFLLLALFGLGLLR